MRIKSLIVTIILFSVCRLVLPQAVVITDDAAYTSGHSSSVLDVKSTNKGLLIPRLTQAERNAIGSPAGGLMIYQTDNIPGFYFYNGSSWTTVGQGPDGSETKVNSGASINITGTGSLASPYTPAFRTQSVTRVQRIAISSPFAGQIVWCSDCGTNGEMQLYNGTSWTTWCGGATAPTLPSITTTSVSSIAGTTASSGGDVISDGGGTVSARGVCWNTSSGPTIANSKTTDGSGTGTFTSSVTGLSPSTLYYLRAYATNNAGTSYGNEVSFTTVPVISGTTPGSRCGTGTITLGATASSGTINWYAASSGGSSLGTGTSFTTPSISSTTSYWVDATNSAGTSSPRAEITATVNAIPTITGTTPSSRCGTGTVTLGATASAGTINWYSAVSGGSSLGTGTSYTTPGISLTTTYYVDATANGCSTGSRTSIDATVNTVPSAPSGATGASRCGTGTVAISVSSPGAGLTVDWYAASSGGSVLAGGTGTISYTTSSISSTTTYYAETRNTTTGCVSATRTSVTATINTIPTITGTTPASRCGTGTLTLGATASAGTINWYSASTGGSSLGSGTSFTTPSISNSTTYYIDATSGGCTTVSRTSVVATVNTIPTITGTTPASRCGAGTVTLGATASAGTINWYSASTGGSSLGTGTSYTTPSISSTTTYYVDATSNGCTTASRSSVTATVNTYTPTISTTVVSSITKNSAISGGNITADGGSAVTSRGICWSTSANPTLANNYTANGSGNGSYNVTMTGLSASTTYYVRAYATNCSGTYYGTQQSFTTLAAISVGDSYGGGIVAYIFQSGDPGYVAGETHGLIAATSDIPYLTPWGCNGYTQGASGTALVAGYSNTAIIISMCYDLCAAYYCWYTYTSGYTDWYLPSRDELSKLYLNKSAIGGFSNAIYWSSSETDFARAWIQDFTTGTQYSTGSKASSYQTRQVRRF
jgi:hypothetical protein